MTTATLAATAVSPRSLETERVLTVQEAAKILRLSKWSIYDAIGRGQVPAVRIGRRLLVPRAGLERLLNV